MNKNDVKTKCKYKRWISFFWGSWKYERNGPRAKLTWRSKSAAPFLQCVLLLSMCSFIIIFKIKNKKRRVFMSLAKNGIWGNTNFHHDLWGCWYMNTGRGTRFCTSESISYNVLDLDSQFSIWSELWSAISASCVLCLDRSRDLSDLLFVLGP